MTRGTAGLRLGRGELGASEAVSMRSRLSQKMGKRKKKNGERKREREKERRTPPGNIGSTQKARVPF